MRQLIFGLIALLFMYGGCQLLRAVRIGFRRHIIPLTTKKTGRAGTFDYRPPALTKGSDSDITVAVYSHKQSGVNAPETEETQVSLDSFAVELELQRLRLEISALQETIEAQQKEINSLRAKNSQAAPRIETLIPFAVQEPDMSPEYDEALALARRGIMADVIASRCGITRAEADLVASLAMRGERQREGHYEAT